MSGLKHLFLSGLVGVLVSSCSNYVYIPVTPNMPLHREPGELQATGSTGDETTFNGSYAVMHHLAVQATFSYFKNNDDELNQLTQEIQTYSTTIPQWELGAGYYEALGNHGSLECYGLYGQGTVKSEWDDPGAFSETLRYRKFSLQPIIGVRNDWIETGFSPRFSFVRFTDYSNTINLPDDPRAGYLDALNNGSGQWLFEPTAMVRLGWKHVKLFAALTLPYPFDSDFEQVVFPTNFAIGISFRFQTSAQSGE